MDTQSFAFGMLAAFGIILIATIVFGIFKVIAQGKQIRNLEDSLNSIESSINRRIDEVELHTDQRISGIENRLDATRDTLLQRIEIGETETLNKVNRTIDRNENITHKKIEDLKRSLTTEQINS